MAYPDYSQTWSHVGPNSKPKNNSADSPYPDFMSYQEQVNGGWQQQMDQQNAQSKATAKAKGVPGAPVNIIQPPPPPPPSFMPNGQPPVSAAPAVMPGATTTPYPGGGGPAQSNLGLGLPPEYANLERTGVKNLQRMADNPYTMDASKLKGSAKASATAFGKQSAGALQSAIAGRGIPLGSGYAANQRYRQSADLQTGLLGQYNQIDMAKAQQDRQDELGVNSALQNAIYGQYGQQNMFTNQAQQGQQQWLNNFGMGA